MLGKPKYTYDDTVKFKTKNDEGKECEIVGKVYIIDSYGTFFDNSDVSYDIMVEAEDNLLMPGRACLYKHVREDRVEKVGD